MNDTAIEGAELPAEVQQQMDEIVKVTKRGFDPRARLEGKGLRKATITLFLDEEKGLEVGWAYDIKNQVQQVIRRERQGVIGELDAALMEKAEIDKDYAEQLAAASVIGDKGVQKQAIEAAQKLAGEEIDAKIAELEAKRDALIEEMTKTGLTIKMRAVPPVIQKDCRRRAKDTLGITTKGVPEDQEEAFNLAYTAHLMSVMFQSVIDNESGDVNDTTTYDDAVAYMDLLPPSQWARLDAKLGEVQFTDAISRAIESQEDFS